MTLDRHTQHKQRIASLREAMYDFEEVSVRKALTDLCAPDAVFRLCHPIGETTGSDAFMTRPMLPCSRPYLTWSAAILS